MAESASTSRPSSSERHTKRQRTGNDHVQQDHESEERMRLVESFRESRPVLLLPKTAPRGAGTGHFSLLLKSDDDDNENDKAASVVCWRELVALHDQVSQTIPQGVTWGEGSETSDPRRRRYAFLPGQRQRLLAMGIRIQAEGSSKETNEHDFTMSSKVSMDLMTREENAAIKRNKDSADSANQPPLSEQPHILSQSTYDALQYVTQRIQTLVPTRYKPYVTMDELVAVQPNHHNGASFLPAHLDFCRSDGFGVVIATLCIRNTNGSKVILMDDGDTDNDPRLSWSLSLQDGDVYFLSGDARNKCLHGILSSSNDDEESDSCFRETLNLRYGLHSPEFAHEEIERHWPE